MKTNWEAMEACLEKREACQEFLRGQDGGISRVGPVEKRERL
jgi:hypothetical protein